MWRFMGAHTEFLTQKRVTRRLSLCATQSFHISRILKMVSAGNAADCMHALSHSRTNPIERLRRERLRAFALPGGRCHGLALGVTGFIRQAAAVLGKKTYQRIHMLDIWTVVQITALAPALHEASVNELFQVEGQGWSRDVQSLDQF